MKRHLLIIAIFLLLGAVVNVAVAWGASISTSLLKVSAGNDPLPDEEANTLWHEYFGEAAQVAGARYDGPTVTLTLLQRWNGGLPWLFLVQSGWPTRSLEGAILTAPDDSFAFVERHLLRLDVGRMSGYGSLPLRPIWPDFAINTLFYATLLWLPIGGLFVLRRFLRVRRGLCPKCAYRMGESAVCTECGIALPRRRRMATLT